MLNKMIKTKPMFISLPLFFFILPAFSLQLKLIRSPFGSDPLQTRLDRIRNLVRHDHTRNRFISASLARKINPECIDSSPPPPPLPTSFAMPIRSGAYTGTGQYFVRVRVGTPAQKFLLVADTGSDLTWVKCENGNSNRSSKRVFFANKSRTFRPIKCSSGMCKTQLPFSLTSCPSENASCGYDYGYSDGSTSQGFFAHESATISLSNGQKKKLKNLIVGCTSKFVGTSFRSADGVLGLGYSNISFSSRASSRFNGKFSYCLVDHLSPKNVSSYLTFGPNKLVARARQTRLVIEPTIEPFYAVGITAISVSGEVLRIPRSIWNLTRGGGTILDSGTSLTILVEPAYKAVVASLSRGLESIPRVDVDPFAFCYNWTNVGRGFEVPGLVIHFDGAARFEPPSKSYLIDVADGVKCIGFVSTPWPGVSTIGNIIQQEHLWEFDIGNKRVRFQRSSCAKGS